MSWSIDGSNPIFKQIYNMLSPPWPLPIDPFLEPLNPAPKPFDNIADMPNFIKLGLQFIDLA